MILRYQFYSLCSKWSFYGGVTHELSQCRCDSSNPFSNNWILPLITLASTLREFQCGSPDPHCKYLHFLIDHIRLQASVRLQTILPTGSSLECVGGGLYPRKWFISGCDQGCPLRFLCDQCQCALSNSSSRDLHTAILDLHTTQNDYR